MANTNQTGNNESPFSKTVMMMQIEKLEEEVRFYQDAVKQGNESIRMISEIMGMYSEANKKAYLMTDGDFKYFMSVMNRYCPDLDLKDEYENGARHALYDFLRYKLGTAYAEVNRAGLSTDGIASQVP